MKNLSKFWQKRLAYLREERLRNMHWSTVVTLCIFVLVFYSFQRFDLKKNMIMAEDTPIVIEFIPPTGDEKLPEPPKIRIPVEADESDDVTEPEDIPTVEKLFALTKTPSVAPPKEEEEYFSVIKVHQKPRLKKMVSPEYPELAIKSGLEGTVHVLIFIGKDGRVEKAKILKSSHSIFNKSAIEAAKQYVFTPAKIGLKPVRVKMVIPIRYRLKK